MNSFGIAQSVSSWYGILIMGSLACLSVYMAALIWVRHRFYKSVYVNSQKLLTDCSRALEENDSKVIAGFRGQRASDPPVRILISSALNNSELSSAELRELFQVTKIRQRERLTKGLSVFGTIATISPFMGLLGTVMGIIESFQSLATTGAAGPNVVASGVAAALWTTAAGLVVAIPSVVAYNIFKNKAKGILTDMEVVAQELLILLKVNKPHKLKALLAKEA